MAKASPPPPQAPAPAHSAAEVQATTEEEAYEVVHCLPDRPHVRSLPLFLPRNVRYDPRTNTVSSAQASQNRADGRNGSGNGSGNGNEVDGYDEQLVVVPHAGVDMLSRVHRPVGCVACVGPYRTGKSLLLSRFLRDSKSFRLGPTLEGCTRYVDLHVS